MRFSLFAYTMFPVTSKRKHERNGGTKRKKTEMNEMRWRKDKKCVRGRGGGGEGEHVPLSFRCVFRCLTAPWPCTRKSNIQWRIRNSASAHSHTTSPLQCPACVVWGNTHNATLHSSGGLFLKTEERRRKMWVDTDKPPEVSCDLLWDCEVFNTLRGSAEEEHCVRIKGWI